MKATTLSATAALLVATAFGGAARADHRQLRDLDDHVFEALATAREARWEIHDHFTQSRDYADLLTDSRELTSALRSIQDAVYQERAPERILRLIDNAHDKLTHLREHVSHSDMAFRRPAALPYPSFARSRPAESVHVREMKRLLDEVDGALHAAEDIVELMLGHDHHDHGPATGNGGGGYRLQPVVPQPVVPFVIPSGRSAAAWN